MSQLRSSRNNHPRRTSVAHEEEKAWVAFYRRIGDPAIAAELIQHLDADPDMKRTHPALYLRCKQTLRLNKERNARNKRIGQFVRRAFHLIFVVPVVSARRMLQLSGDIAVECLPETRTEPAARRVKALSDMPEFANERGVFHAEMQPQQQELLPTARKTSSSRAKAA